MSVTIYYREITTRDRRIAIYKMAVWPLMAVPFIILGRIFHEVLYVPIIYCAFTALDELIVLLSGKVECANPSFSGTAKWDKPSFSEYFLPRSGSSLSVYGGWIYFLSGGFVILLIIAFVEVVQWIVRVCRNIRKRNIRKVADASKNVWIGERTLLPSYVANIDFKETLEFLTDEFTPMLDKLFTGRHGVYHVVTNGIFLEMTEEPSPLLPSLRGQVDLQPLPETKIEYILKKIQPEKGLPVRHVCPEGESLALYSDKSKVYVNPVYFDYLASRYPSSEVLCFGTYEPVVFTVDGKIRGLLMPKKGP